MRKTTITKVQKRNPLDFVPNHFYCNSVFPNKPKHLEDLSRIKGLKLKTILYKLNDNGTSLTGIQFKYSDGVKSPFFQTKDAAMNLQTRKFKLKTDCTIRRVSLKLDGQSIGGIRLYDERNEYVMNI